MREERAAGLPANGMGCGADPPASVTYVLWTLPDPPVLLSVPHETLFDRERPSFSDQTPMLRPITLLMAAAALAAALAACAPKGQEGAQGTGDSTVSPSAFTDSATAQDSIGPAPSDSVAVAPLGTMALSGAGATTLRDSVGSKSTGTKPRAGAYIGRDSAFGPSFTVDSMGKVTPIAPAKKKP